MTQHTFNTTPNYIHKHVNWDYDISESASKFVKIHPLLHLKYIHKHVIYDLDVSENVLEIVAIHPQLYFLCNLF
jgi:hypothetical protein